MIVGRIREFKELGDYLNRQLSRNKNWKIEGLYPIRDCDGTNGAVVIFSGPDGEEGPVSLGNDISNRKGGEQP